VNENEIFNQIKEQATCAKLKNLINTLKHELASRCVACVRTECLCCEIVQSGQQKATSPVPETGG
jgi:hypothetical protein